MNDKVNKSSLEQAKAEFESIRKFALNEAEKGLEEKVSQKVVELMNQKLEEGFEESSDEEKEVVQEEVTINAGETTITIDDNGNVDVDTEEGLEGLDGVEDVEMDSEEDDEGIVVSDEEDEIEIDNSELEEMNLDEMNFEEQEAAAPMDAAAAPEAAPVDDMAAPMEEPMDDMGGEEMANPFQQLMDKMDEMMSMMGGSPAGEEVEVVDDAAAAAPVDAAAAAPVAEEITFEVVNDMQVPEMETDVLEIVGEDEMMEDAVDENTMSGQGHAARRAAGNQDDAHGRTKPEVAAKRKRAVNEGEENKAQYEARIAELIKENESLKTEVDEKEAEMTKFHNSFIKLQENYGEMQDSIAKTQLAYRIAISGNLSQDEKLKLSEQFDNCETLGEAEALYKSVVSENHIKVNKNPEKGIKSSSIKTAPVANSKSEPLYESKEVKRMKELAGIKKLNG